MKDAGLRGAMEEVWRLLLTPGSEYTRDYLEKVFRAARPNVWREHRSAYRKRGPPHPFHGCLSEQARGVGGRPGLFEAVKYEREGRTCYRYVGKRRE